MANHFHIIIDTQIFISGVKCTMGVSYGLLNDGCSPQASGQFLAPHACSGMLESIGVSCFGGTNVTIDRSSNNTGTIPVAGDWAFPSDGHLTIRDLVVGTPAVAVVGNMSPGQALVLSFSNTAMLASLVF
jgi:hypothetical protein